MMTDLERLAAYLERLKLDAAPAPDVAGLTQLQMAHRHAIAFENLDIRLGRSISVDADGAFDKLVTQGRGGYCFQQNRLFADMLALIGLPSRALLARSQLGLIPGEVPPLTHTLLLLEIDGEPWIADAGFGGSFAPPLPLRDGAIASTDDGASHRLRRIGEAGDLGGEWLLERGGTHVAMDNRALPGDDWKPQYVFDLRPVAPIDLELSNHWTSTRPDTRFVTGHFVSIVTPGGFAALTATTLKQYQAQAGASEQQLTEPAAYHAALRDIFRLSISLADVEALPLFA